MRSPPFGGEIQPAIGSMAIRIGVINVFQRDRFQAAACGLGKTEFHRCRLGLGHLQLFHARDLLELALRLAGETGLRAEAVGKALQAFDLALLCLVGVGLLLRRRRRCPITERVR